LSYDIIVHSMRRRGGRVQQYLMIAVGGALGAIARYQVAATVQSRIVSAFPWGTFLVNVSGCFVMGLAATVLAEKVGLHQNWRFLVPIGFIGAYTTFSTFELETYRAVTAGDLVAGMANVLASVIVGYVALWLGVMTARLA
jgi:CrcB protein